MLRNNTTCGLFINVLFLLVNRNHFALLHTERVLCWSISVTDLQATVNLSLTAWVTNALYFLGQS